MTLFAQFVFIAGLCGFFIWIAMHLAMIPWRRSEGRHWTDRARLLWPARKTGIAGMAAGVSCALLGGRFVFEGDFSLGYVWMPALLGLIGIYPSSREIEPGYRFLLWFREVAWVILLRGGPIFAALYLMGTLPDEMEAADWWLVFTCFLASAFLASGLWLPLVLRRVKEGHTFAPMQRRLDRIAAEASGEGGVRPRHVWLGESPLANAMALPLIRSVLFTTRAMEILEDGEARAVMLHEMAHLRETFLMGLLRVLSAVSFFLFVFVRPVLHAWGLPGLMGLFAVYVLFLRFVGLMMRRMENRADSAATGITGESTVYARALEKIYEANQIPAVMPGNRMVHPHLYDRMVSAGVTPDYPRPAPPARWSGVAWGCLVIAVAVTVVSFLI